MVNNVAKSTSRFIPNRKVLPISTGRSAAVLFLIWGEEDPRGPSIENGTHLFRYWNTVH